MHCQDISFRNTSGPFFFYAAFFAPALSTEFQNNLGFSSPVFPVCQQEVRMVQTKKKIPPSLFLFTDSVFFFIFQGLLSGNTVVNP